MIQTPIPSSQGPEKLPGWKKLMYALGQFGWSLVTYAVGNLLVYFYFPPTEGGHQIFPVMIYQGFILGVLTVLGLIFWAGRALDAFTDPLIASFSDRSRSKFGRRRIFMAVAAVPFALLSVAVFLPPFGAGAAANVEANSWWVFATVVLFYIAMSLYVTPFYAWMSELGRDSNERLGLSTMISITWALGFMVGTQTLSFAKIFEDAGMGPTEAFRTVLWIIAGVSLVCMLLPVIFIDEKRYCAAVPTDDRVVQSLKKVVGNKNFMRFTWSDFTYWISLTFITSGMVYFVTVLLNFPKEFYSQLMLVMFLLSFLCYVPVNFIAKRVGKRRLLIIAFSIFAVVYAFAAFLGLWPLDAQVQGYVVAVLASVALAVFGIIPNALVSDLAEAWAVETGEHKAGIYFGFRTFMQKMGASVAALVLPSLIKIGAPEGTLTGDLGVRLAAVFALVFCIVGLVLLFLYDEKKVNRILAGNRD